MTFPVIRSSSFPGNLPIRFNNILDQKEIDSLNEKIAKNEDTNKERWVALLDSDPIKHVTDIKWANPVSDPVPDEGIQGRVSA